jgi:hypothetical protein
LESGDFSEPQQPGLFNKGLGSSDSVTLFLAVTSRLFASNEQLTFLPHSLSAQIGGLWCLLGALINPDFAAL